MSSLVNEETGVWGSLGLVLRILVLGLAGSGGYLIALAVYRLTLHPLAKYPGPFWAKITDWYSVYHAWKGDRHLEFWKCHERYGPVFRYGPNAISVNTASALKTIYGHKANVQKAAFYTVFPPTKDTFNTHSTINKPAHARKRRVLSHAFSDHALRDMEDYVLGHVRTFCNKLGLQPLPFYNNNNNVALSHGGEKNPAVWSSPQNMSDLSNYLTFDVMGDLCFGKAFEMLDHDENRHVTDLIGSAAKMHLILGTNPDIKKFHLNTLLFSETYAKRMQYMAYSRVQAGERTKLGLDIPRKDFFYYLLTARDPETGGPGFTGPELWGESNLLIIAGSDTTSTALAAVFFYLTRNPHALETLQHEIRGRFSSVEEIKSGETLAGCKYLRAVIDESMRLSPPVGGVLPREILTGGLEISGPDMPSLSLPAGVEVGVPHYAIHHNSTYFPAPFAFAPERWIPDAISDIPGVCVGHHRTVTADDVARAQSAFCPFSIGPRGCIGKGLAYLELTTSVARCVYMYDMKRAEGALGLVGEGSARAPEGRRLRGEFQLQDTFTSLKDGPWVQFAART